MDSWNRMTHSNGPFFPLSTGLGEGADSTSAGQPVTSSQPIISSSQGRCNGGGCCAFSATAVWPEPSQPLISAHMFTNVRV
eukprot:1159359-Pelagomonas_calceolata.AAC.10